MKLAVALLCLFISYVRCCGVNELACGNACYLPGDYYCTNGLLCPTGYQICNGQCYSPAHYSCVDTLMQNSTFSEIYNLCPVGLSGCGYQCINTNSYTCINPSAGFYCPVGLQSCNNNCFDPTLYTCIVSQPSYAGTLCPLNSQVCNGTCYPSNQFCEDNTTPNSCCDLQGTCYSTNYRACPTGMSCCFFRPVWEYGEGGYCYDSTKQVCANCPVYNPNHPQTTICPIDQPTCCANGCTSEQCCHTYGTYDSFVCPLGATCCGVNNVANATCCLSGQTCSGDTANTKPTCS